MTASVVFMADINRLRELMPEKVRNEVQPLQVWPGRGVVALTAYAYKYCDNDSYNEISLSIVTSKPGKSSFGPCRARRATHPAPVRMRSS